MATTFNKIILVGHLSRDPELRSTATGTAMATFGLATNHRYKAGETWQEETCFLDVVFGRQAEAVGDHLHKGSQALVEGRVRQHTWETPDGQKRHKHEVVAERVPFLGVRSQETDGAPVEAGALVDIEEDLPVLTAPRGQGSCPPPVRLSVTHNFCFRASWGMLRTSFLSDISKSNPCPQESGMRHVATATNWAVSELADAERGDERRPKRLGELAKVLGQPPPAALPEACGDGGMLKGASRFFAHDAIEAQDLLQSHGESTYRRLDHASVVLAVHDTTAVNWTRHPATQGLGPLGHTAWHGLLVHTTCALTPERVPLGLLAQQGWARDPNDVGQRARRTQLPISQQESQTWLPSLDAVCTARDCCPTIHLVSVGEREAAVSDVLAAARPAGVDRLLRAAWARWLSGPERSLWATVEAPPVGDRLLLNVPRRGPQAARAVTWARRFCPVTRCPPRHRQREGVPAVTRWAVQVQAVDPPTDVTPIAGLLWTTVAVDTMAEASERVEWYAGRWGMEGGIALCTASVVLKNASGQAASACSAA